MKDIKELKDEQLSKVSGGAGDLNGQSFYKKGDVFVEKGTDRSGSFYYIWIINDIEGSDYRIEQYRYNVNEKVAQYFYSNYKRDTSQLTNDYIKIDIIINQII